MVRKYSELCPCTLVQCVAQTTDVSPLHYIRLVWKLISSQNNNTKKKLWLFFSELTFL